MSLRKYGPKRGPTHFLAKLVNSHYRGKSNQKMSNATFVIFEKPPKENNRPMGENSPNLVTLSRNPVHRKVNKNFIFSFPSR
jgi:hypothetical protein